MNKETIKLMFLTTGGFLFGVGLINEEGILAIPLFLGFFLVIVGMFLESRNLEENLSEQEIKEKVDLILLRKGKLSELGEKY